MWIATEINLHHENTIQEAFNRQLAAKIRKVFWDLNPSSPASFIYREYIDRFPEQYGDRYCYEHFTIRDNLTITPQRLADIEAQYDKNSIWYRRDILGQRCNAEGLIYDMFRTEKHVLDVIPETEGDYYVSSDYGIQNANVWLLWRRIRFTNNWICLRESYYSGRDEKRQKTDEELYGMLADMLGAVRPANVIIDPSAASMISVLRRHDYSVRKANNDVKSGIADVSTMLATERLFFSSECTHAIEEFGLYAWDEKAVERGEDAPLKINDHAMDAIRYFVKTMNLVRRDDATPYKSAFFA